MSYVTIGVLALTAIAIIFGTLWGMGRGVNRSILRLILIIACVVGAVFLRPILVEIIMGIDIGEGTIADMIAEGLTQGGQTMPESMTNLVYALVQVLLELASYFIIFFALRFISWTLIFPICKIFVRKEAKKKKGLGALVGLVQGLVIAFAVVVPLNGLAVDFEKISKLEMEGKPLMEIPAEVGLSDHVTSSTNNFYDTIGGWYYDMLTTTKNKEGKDVTLSGACGAMGAMTEIGTVFGEEGLMKGMKTMSDPDATAEQKVNTLTQVSQKIRESANALNGLDENGREIFNDVLADLKELVGEQGGENSAMFENLSIETLSLGDVADCLEGLATYIEKTRVNISSVTQEDVDKIVDNFEESEFLVNTLIGDGTGTVGVIYQVENTDRDKFISAIDGTELTLAQKIALKNAFGVN